MTATAVALYGDPPVLLLEPRRQIDMGGSLRCAFQTIPIADNKTEEGRAKNRRVEIANTACIPKQNWHRRGHYRSAL